MGKCQFTPDWDAFDQAEQDAQASLDPTTYFGCTPDPRAPYGNQAFIDDNQVCEDPAVSQDPQVCEDPTWSADPQVCEDPTVGQTPAPRLGLDAYDVVPDDFVGPLGPNQIRASQRADLDRFNFSGFNVVPDSTTALQPGQMTQTQYDQMQRAWLNIADNKGMNISGTPQDRDAFRQMLRDGMGGSTNFRDLITSIGNDTDPAHRIQANVGRNQPGCYWDSFSNNNIDLDDLDQLRSNPDAAHRDAFTREDDIAHFLAERQDALVNGHNFRAAHSAGMTTQNNVRAERGATAITSQTGNQRPDGSFSDGTFQLKDGRTHTFTFGNHAEITGQVEPH